MPEVFYYAVSRCCLRRASLLKEKLWYQNLKILIKFNVKHSECLRDHPSQRLMIKCLTIIQTELEFENVGFWGEGKAGVPGEKHLAARKRTNNKVNPHMTPGPGIEPGTHWWEASALTTAPSLLSNAEKRFARNWMRPYTFDLYIDLGTRCSQRSNDWNILGFNFLILFSI